jgi:hypothetical protein
MADRQRTTWQAGDKAATSSQPVLPVERARAASAHPATPDEGAAHPAHQPDPTQPADYENGDTSSWAEDPTTGPYPNSAHPATPDEGAAHPAHRQAETAPGTPGDQMTNEDAGVSKAAAKELRAAVERKAAKCIRISSKLLGRKATVAAVEDQALDFMDMSDMAIQTTLGRLAAEESDEDASDDEDEDGKKAADESDEDASDDDEDGKKASDEKLLRQLLAEEEDDDDDSDKEASQDLTASEQILAAIAGLGSRIDSLESGKTSTSDDDVLAGLLAEEEVAPVAMDEAVVEDDVEAMLMSMIDDESDVAGCGDEMAMDESDMLMDDPGDLGIDMGLVEDPMGLLGEVELEGDEEALLAQLFADSRMAGDESDEDAEDEEDEGKKASARKPRPKKASAAGATRLGRVTKEAQSDIRELEKLWPTAPDVTGVFG